MLPDLEVPKHVQNTIFSWISELLTTAQVKGNKFEMFVPAALVDEVDVSFDNNVWNVGLPVYIFEWFYGNMKEFPPEQQRRDAQRFTGTFSPVPDA